MPLKTQSYGAKSAEQSLKCLSIERRDVGPKDVHIEVLFCGVCHSDLHVVRNEWGSSKFPVVPGHEIVGVVKSTGKDVAKVKPGDTVGVGCLVGSCNTCRHCRVSSEQNCSKSVWTYNSTDFDGTQTYGGYSKDIVVTEHFVCTISNNMKQNLDRVAPLLCAGITTYNPMKTHGMDKPGKKIGVVGLGGLGHMAVKFGVAWGNDVTVISTSERKKNEALEKFGAKHFLISTDPVQMAEANRSLDYIIDTVSSSKDITQMLALLKPGGVLVTVGLPNAEVLLAIPPSTLVLNSIGVFGSLIGGIDRTQEMLNFCAEKSIYADIELIEMNYINQAYERMLSSDVHYRFVIDIKKSKF